MNSLTKSLYAYCANPRSDIANFNVAHEYDKIGQAASSLSFYLRAAELTSNKEIAYLSLLRNHINFCKQGRRPTLARNQVMYALGLLPKRPEAHYLLSRQYEVEKNWEGSYTQCCVALQVCDFNSPPLPSSIDYPGYYGILFQKAVASWWVGRCDEARSLFRHLADNYEMVEPFVTIVRNNIKNLGIASEPASNYSSEQAKELRFKFKNNEKIKNNFSQTYQDIFVLSMLDGKENGTYLEIGSGDPYQQSNTALLEQQFNWRGISIDKDQNHTEKFAQHRKNPVITKDISEIDFKELLDNSGFGKTIDYLQIDCEPAENTFTALKKIPFDEYKFAVITFEHDYYKEVLDGVTDKKVRERSREFLISKGYILVAGDIAPDYINSYEDWWVHPELISFDIIQVMLSSKNGLKKAKDYILDKLNDHAVTVNKKPQYWKTTQHATMEFTTSIPAAGCIVDCAFCPQRTLVQAYSGTKTMSLEDFKTAVNKLPREVRVTFAGFTEPWLNRNCTDMVLYAHERGHPVSVFTTGIGMSVEDVRKIKHIPFNQGPNGGFCLHLPDEERIAKHPISKKYIEVLEYFKSVQHEIKGFYVMSMGPVHKDVSHIFPTAHIPPMWSRAGNLLGEAIIKPELEKIKDRFKHMDHGNKEMTCNCEEKLYHNVCLPNGDVSLCCMDYGLKYILGNLITQDYEDIIPKPLTCFKLCQGCENAIEPHRLQ